MSIQPYSTQAFIELALARGVLKFGEFSLKSGRISPYFFNAGLFNDGEALSMLASGYAKTLMDCEGVSVIFGPAYKGIPLAAVTASALWHEHGVNVPWAFNRKEAKDHGEGGTIVGAPLEGRVLIVDDVISAGTACREAANLVTANGATLAGIAISLDRQERGTGEKSAVQEVEEAYGISVLHIIALQDVIQHIEETAEDAALLQRIQDYRDTYGVD